MRNVLVAMAFFGVGLLAHASDNKSHLNGLEQIVTCEETREAGAAFMAVKDTSRYGTKNGRFFYPLKPETVFGMDLRWVGGGVMDQPGPNVTLAGSLEDAKNRVEEALDRKLTCESEGCFWQKSKYRVVLIYPHQKDASLVMVQCAYNDP